MDNNKITVETLAMDVIEQEKRQAKMWFIAWMVTIAVLIGTNAYWIYTMNSYEYVYQDGTGQNNYNSNISGDVNNVTTDQTQEEQKEPGNQEKEEERVR